MAKLADECSDAIQKKVAESLLETSDCGKSSSVESKLHGDASAILSAAPIAGQPSGSAIGGPSVTKYEVGAPSKKDGLVVDSADLILEKELEAVDAAAIPTKGSVPSVDTSTSNVGKPSAPTTPAATPKGTGKRPRGGATADDKPEKQAKQLTKT